MKVQKYLITNDITNSSYSLSKSELITFGFNRAERDTLISGGFTRGFRLTTTKVEYTEAKQIKSDLITAENLMDGSIITVDIKSAWTNYNITFNVLAQGNIESDYRALNYKELNQQAQNEHYKFVKREIIKNQMRDLIKTRNEANVQLIELQNELAKYR